MHPHNQPNIKLCLVNIVLCFSATFLEFDITNPVISRKGGFLMIKPKPERTTKEVVISAIYLPDKQWQMLELAWIHLGYSSRSIAKNALQGFFAREKQYYIEAALRDANSRGISQQEHYKILRDGGKLPRINNPANHPASPIAWVPDLVIPANKRRYSSIEMSAFNYTLLQF
jgi:hypothetical protein